ncbi:MAG: hypothetical protein WCF94_04045 [bacterium]
MIKIVFIISFVLALSMLLLKVWEEKREKKTRFSLWCEHFDKELIRFGKKVEKEFSEWDFKDIVMWIKSIIRQQKMKILAWKKGLDSKQPKFLLAQTGRKSEPSYFLKAISEHKDKMKRG